jgi:hypothetical protein
MFSESCEDTLAYCLINCYDSLSSNLVIYKNIITLYFILDIITYDIYFGAMTEDKWRERHGIAFAIGYWVKVHGIAFAIGYWVKVHGIAFAIGG